MVKISLLVLAAGLSTSLAQTLGPITRTVIEGPTDTCGPTPVTKVYKTTYTTRRTVVTDTVTSIGKEPHSCYTATETGLKYCAGYDPKTCGPVPLCIRLETKTIPCPDDCCPTTPTATVKHCLSCQTGCATTTKTVSCGGVVVQPTGPVLTLA